MLPLTVERRALLPAHYGVGHLLTLRYRRLCESGFIPGCLYTLSRWYKKDEISKRFAIYFFGNNLATALSGLLSAGM